MLRRGAGEEIEIAAELQAGAMGEIEVEAKNKISLRQVTSNPDPSPDANPELQP